jgi:hypothetical protein
LREPERYALLADAASAVEEERRRKAARGERVRQGRARSVVADDGVQTQR